MLNREGGEEKDSYAFACSSGNELCVPLITSGVKNVFVLSLDYDYPILIKGQI